MNMCNLIAQRNDVCVFLQVSLPVWLGLYLAYVYCHAYVCQVHIDDSTALGETGLV